MPHSARSDVVASRYASSQMVEVFSPERRIRLWRELWLAIAEAQHELGLPISKAQIAELQKYVHKINWDVAERREREMRHEVMAHVYAYGLQCKKAAGIIHLGCTSSYVMDNADLIMIKDGLHLIVGKLASAIDRLGSFAERERSTVTTAYTHFQPAQPTTVGRRGCIWLANLVMDLSRLEFELANLKFHGCKGATGTEDSYLKLFEGDRAKVRLLEKLVTRKMGFDDIYPVTGQTYPRKVDTHVVGVLAGICESAAKFATDVRLLQALHEVSEPMEETQIGSSAMPYKHNPMRTERIVSLARYVMNLLKNCYDTASNQWFERTLDDSANRRLTIPQAFLITDGILDLTVDVVLGLRVRHAVIEQNLSRELPFLQTEEILMAAAREGGDRQQLHERIRKHAKEVIKLVREKGQANDLLARLRKDPAFRSVPPKLLVRTDPKRLTGLATEQVEDFLRDTIEPIRRKYRTQLKNQPQIRV
ncbi:MAG: adenylosuccinate lyase [Pseudomonadota bacterium]